MDFQDRNDVNDSEVTASEGAPATSAARSARTVVIQPDANNVVTLPDGVSFDTIVADGNDLIIQADGVIYVIPDGAIIVPQLVVDGVTVPALNLSALLIGNEIIPDLGPELQSSGGNFAATPGDIQAAYDLGDLLPYTELAFPEQPDEEIIPNLADREPEVIVITPDNPAGAVSATDTVNEAGLPERSGEPAGTDFASDSESTTGTISFASPDGLESIALNGVAITAVGQTFVTDSGVLTITSIAPGEIGYSYTLTDNRLGQDATDDFAVTVTDTDGDVASATLTITIVDDAPIALDDTDSIAAGTYGPETGNVITGIGTTSGEAGVDTLGADDATLTAIASGSGAPSDVSEPTIIAGEYGTLTIAPDGSYTYVRGEGTPGGVSDDFTYTLTDSDGSTATAVLTIEIGDSPATVISVPETGDPGTIVDESGLPVRPDEAPGTQAPTPVETTEGTVTFVAPDGPATVEINGIVITGPGQVITVPEGTLTIITYDPDAGVIDYGFTLGDNTAGDDTSVTFDVTVTDVDGDSDDGSFTITIIDDVPDAVDDSGAQDGEDAPVTVDIFVNDVQGADSVQLDTIAVVDGTLSGDGTLVNNGDGTFTYTPAPGEEDPVTFDYTITDGDGDVSTATVTITLGEDSTPTIGVEGESEVDEAGLPVRGDEPEGSQAAGNSETAAGVINITTGGDTVGSLVINGVDVTSGGTVSTDNGDLVITLDGGVYSYTYTLTDNTLTDPDADTFSITVTDSDGDPASTTLVIAIIDDTPSAEDDAGAIAAGEYGPVTGSVVANDTPGADGIVVTSYTGSGGSASGADGSVVQGLYGTLTIDADGNFSYTRDPGTPGGVSDTFNYVITDGDGDIANADLVISIADSPPTLDVPTTGEAGTLVDEAGLAGPPAGSDAANDGELTTGTITYTAPDGPGSVTIDGVAITAVGQTITGDFGTLTVDAIANGSITYSYELTVATLGDSTFDTFDVVVTDQDGDSIADTLQIDIVDDTPEANPDTDTVEDGGITVVSGNLITDAEANGDNGADVTGADGASLSTVSGQGGGSPGDGFYGDLNGLTAAGDYTYTLDETNPLVEGLDSTETLTEQYAYTIIDGDGDIASSTLTITIQGQDDPVVITGLSGEGAEQLVDEDDLADGSSPDAPALTQAGSFTVDSMDGLTNLTVGGVEILDGVTYPITVTGDYGTVIITGVTTTTDTTGDITSTTVNYEYVLGDNTLDHTLAGQDNVTDSFSVVATDTDNSTDTASLDILVIDDVPDANPDVDSVTEDGPLIADGNVLTGSGGIDANATDGTADIAGADGATVTGLAFSGTGATGTVGDPLAGAYGSLTIEEDGSYSYELDNTNPLVQGLDDTESLTEEYTYTITDADGDTSTTTLTITVNGADDPIVINGLDLVGPEQTVNEDDLADGSSPDAPALTQTGSFTVDSPDGLAELTAGGTSVWTDAGGFVAGQTITTAIGTFVITGVTPTTTDANGDVTAATVSYSYELTDNTLTHSTPGEDSIIESFQIGVTDTDGSTDSATIEVEVIDDVPTANPDTDTVEDGGITVVSGNLITDAEANGDNGADVTGADGAILFVVDGQGGGSPDFGLYGDLNGLNVGGDYTYTLDEANPLVEGLDSTETLTEQYTYSIIDGDGDVATSTLTITIQGQDDPVVISGLTLEGSDQTVDEDDLADGSSPDAPALTQAGSFTVDSMDGLTNLTVGGTEILDGVTYPVTITGSYGTVIITGVTTTTDTTGDITSATVNYEYVLGDNTLDHSFDGQDSITDSFNVVATDTDNSTDTASLDIRVVDDVPTAFADTNSVDEGGTTAGNVLTDGTDDIFGADGPATTTPAGGVIGVAAGSNIAVEATGAPGVQIESALGFLTLNADGSYTYVSKVASTNVDATDVFTYTIQDGDGDTSTQTLTISVNNVAGQVSDNDVVVDESGLDGSGSQLVPNGEFDTDGQITVTGATGTLTYTLTDPAVGTFGTLALNAATGEYSYELTSAVTDTTGDDGRNTVSGPANGVDTFGYEVRDAGNVLIGSGTITVNVVDDVPIATDEALLSIAEDASSPDSLSGNVMVNDTEGADGATVTSVNIGGTAYSVAAVGSTPVSTANGDYTFDAAGNWTFDPNPGLDQTAGPIDASFTYTLTDGDGDADTATQPISITDGSPPEAGQPVTLTLDDENLANGSAPAAPVEASDTINFTPGSDPITSIVFSTDLSNLDPALTWVRVDDDTITGSDGTDLIVTLELTLVGNAATVTATLSDNFDSHPTAGDDTFDLGSVGVVASDTEGDTATGTINLEVSDDLPVVTGVDAPADALEVDETALGTPDTANFATLFTAAFNADGAAASDAITYALGVSAAGADSGLNDVATSQDVLLRINGAGEVEGYITDGGAGIVVFTLAVDAAGTATLTQARAVTHSDTADANDPASLTGSDLITLTATITDGDGDTDSATVDLTGGLTFYDDGPALDAAVADGDTVQLITQDAETIGILTDTDSSTANFGNAFTIASSSYGADGAGSIAWDFALLLTAAEGSDTGLTSDGGVIYLYQAADGTVQGSTAASEGAVTAGNTIFDLTIAADGTVTVNQYAELDHSTSDSSNYVSDELPLPTGLVAISGTATITDGDGDTVSEMLELDLGGNVIFADDGPTAVADGVVPTLNVDETVLGTDASASFAGAFTTTFGADGAGTTAYALAISAVGADSGLVDIATDNSVFLFLEAGVVVGREGTDATAAATGNVVFTAAVDAGGNVTLDQQRAIEHSDGSDPDDVTGLSASNLISLTATVTDGDGDTATASLNIGSALTFDDDGPAGGTNDTVLLDDDVLAGGNPGGTGDDVDGANLTGTLTHDFGEDGGSIAFDTAGAPAGFQYMPSGDNILIQQDQNGSMVTVMTVTLDPGTGAYTVTQNANVLHETALDENNQDFTLTYTVTDGDNDPASGTLVINVDDDTPTASDNSATTTVTAQDFNVGFILDFSSSVNDTELNEMLIAVKAAAAELFNATSGAVTISTVLFASSGATQPVFTDLAAFETFIDSINPGAGGTRPLSGQTDYTDAIQDFMGYFVPDANANNQVFFISDGNPNQQTGTGALLNSVATQWDTFVNSNDLNVTSIGVGNGINTGPLQDIDVDGSGAPILVADFDDLVGELSAIISALPVSGNVLTDDTPDQFGADGGRILSIEIDGTVYTWDGQPGSELISVATTSGGNIEFNFGTGDWTYTAPSPVTVAVTEVFDYVLIDGDGDTASASLTVNVPSNPQPEINSAAATIAVDEDGLPGGIAGGVDDLAGANIVQSGTLAGFSYGGDGPGGITLGAVADTGLQTLAGNAVETVWDGTTLLGQDAVTGDDVFTLTITDTATGAYTFTLLAPLQHSDPASEDDLSLDIVVTVSDSGGDSVSGTISLTIDDDSAVAVSAFDLTSLTNAAGQSGSAYLDADNDVDNNFGADGGAVVFTAASIAALDAQNLTSGLSSLTYSLSADDTVLTATRDSDSSVVFTLTLDPASAQDQYVLDLVQPLDSTTEIDFNDGGYNFVGGNGSWAGFTQPGTVGSQDLLLTPQENGVNAGTVNTNANEGGISAGNSVGAGEVFRVDFVTDLTGSPNSGQDYGVPANQNHSFSGHYVANGASALITKLNNTASVKIEAFDDTDGDNVLGDGVQDALTAVGISFNGATLIITADGTYTVGGQSFTVTFTGGYAVVDGVVEDTRIAGFTADGYTSIEFGHDGGNTFKIGDFGATTITNDPVDFIVPISVQDGDGDIVDSGNLDITLAAAAQQALQSSMEKVLLSSVDDSAIVPANDPGTSGSGTDQRSAQIASITAMAAGFAFTETMLAGQSDFSQLVMAETIGELALSTNSNLAATNELPDQQMQVDSSFFDGSVNDVDAAVTGHSAGIGSYDAASLESLESVSSYESAEVGFSGSEPAFAFASGIAEPFVTPSVEGAQMMDALLAISGASVEADTTIRAALDMPELTEAFADILGEQAVDGIVSHFAGDLNSGALGDVMTGSAGSPDPAMLHVGISDGPGMFAMQPLDTMTHEDISALTASA